MRGRSAKPYLLFLAALLLLVMIPKGQVEKLRSAFLSIFAPAWDTVAHMATRESEGERQAYRMAAELQLLHSYVEEWQELYYNEKRLNLQLAHHTASDIDLEKVLKPLLEAIPAKVIFRAPSSWNSSLWVNVGSSDNALFDKTVIAKNSPVVVGNSIVGVLDYVGKKQSRVRLITDSGMAPSVRAVRGKAKNQRVINAAAIIQEELQKDASLYGELEKLKESLGAPQATWYLAKGELRGTSDPLFRSRGLKLRGVGFNYDFADSFGPARDLRTGEPLRTDGLAISIIDKGDLLVTTGMDGVFPPGFSVARVTHVEMLKEGDYYYELEALPTAGNLNELSLVHILPPSGFDVEDQPPMR